MFRDRFLKRIFIFTAGLAVILPMLLSGLGNLNPANPFHIVDAGRPAPVITAAREKHILHGDGTGGGHLYGTGRPCASEFPQDWNAKKILATVRAGAANDNLEWKRQKNGYHVAEMRVEKLTIRIVLDGQKREVITAYPVNVPRNPCPAANDNRR